MAKPKAPDSKALDPEAFRTQLLARRDELAALTEAHHEDGATVELDQTRVGRLSRMDALQSQAMAAETERRRLVELDRIAAALKRIDEDEFGYCLACGDAIPIKRLELDPTTPTCIDCARRADHTG